MRICIVEGCGKKHHCKGYCGSHFMRWRTHGDPLAGGTYNGEPMRHFREVVSHYDGEDCLAWPYALDGRGRPQLTVDKVHRVLARVLCEQEHGPPPSDSHEAAHNCGVHWCVNRHHLRWATTAENTQDRFLHGAIIRGTKHYNAQITEEQAREIRALKGKMLQREIAEIFGVKASLVRGIHNGRTWAWLDRSAA